MQTPRFRLAGITVAAALAMTGCASTTKDECLAIDWRVAGYEDGASGHGVERLSSRRQACGKHGVTPDLDAYLAGREEGLREYCQPRNGFRVGASGRGDAGACPEYLAPAFTEGYEAGRTLWRLESRYSSTLRGIEQRRGEVARIDEALVSSGFTIVSDATTPEERAAALVSSRNLAERRGRLLSEIESMERALPGYEAELADYRVQLAYAGW